MFAAWSACSFPAMSAWPGIQTICTFTFLRLRWFRPVHISVRVSGAGPLVPCLRKVTSESESVHRRVVLTSFGAPAASLSAARKATCSARPGTSLTTCRPVRSRSRCLGLARCGQLPLRQLQTPSPWNRQCSRLSPWAAGIPGRALLPLAFFPVDHVWRWCHQIPCGS